MIVGPRAALGLLSPAGALALALGLALGTAPATALTGSPGAAAATATVHAPPGAAVTAARVRAGAGGWSPAWSLRSGSRRLPKGCASYSGRTGGMRWSPSLVRVVGGRLQLATSGSRAGEELAGSGIGCDGRAQRYARVALRARMPRGAGLVARIALWPSTAGRGSDWSGLTIPSADVGPAYATNGCGDEAHGAALPGRLAGAFHDYLVTWSPHGFSVAVDGRTLYQDRRSFDRPRWLGISLSATGPSAAGRRLLVEKLVTYRWTGPVAAAAATGSPDAGATARARGRQDVEDATSPQRDGAGRSVMAPVLDRTHSGGALLIGGTLVALGVLLGVVRAAHAARWRSLTPR